MNDRHKDLLQYAKYYFILTVSTTVLSFWNLKDLRYSFKFNLCHINSSPFFKQIGNKGFVFSRNLSIAGELGE
jgi:hypothetical protein